jgi:hypothetical protein
MTLQIFINLLLLMLLSIVMMILWIVAFLWVADSDIENMRKRGDYPFDLEKKKENNE